MSDEVFTALLPRPGLRVVAALTTEVSREARSLHQAEPGSAALLSEALTAVALLAALQKEKTRVSLQLECDGPVRGLLVDAEGGSIRGYVKKPLLTVLGDEGAFHWRPLLGNSGYLSVLRDLGGGEYSGAAWSSQPSSWATTSSATSPTPTRSSRWSGSAPSRPAARCSGPWEAS